MSFKEGVKFSLSLFMPKTRNWRITESSYDTIRNVAKAFTHIRRWKRAERLKVQHCSPDVGAHKQLSSTWGLFTVSQDAATVSVGKCVNMSL